MGTRVLHACQARCARGAELWRTRQVMVFGVPNTRCLLDGVASLESRGACHTFRALTNQEWAYFKCTRLGCIILNLHVFHGTLVF